MRTTLQHLKKIIAVLESMILIGCTTAFLTGCGEQKDSTDATEPISVEQEQTTVAKAEKVSDEDRMQLLGSYQQNSTRLTLSNSSWRYDPENDVYYQIGVQYCTMPETTEYESMGIYVPGSYMTSVNNGDGTYTCSVNRYGKAGNYTAMTAPIVFPVNTPGYSSQAAPSAYSYEGLSEYLDAGLIYVFAGMRGRSNGYSDNNNLIYSGGAPWGVTDLKAAIRYYRFNEDLLPGDKEAVFTFGMSGGGAQSAIAGASGDSTLYFEYLTSLGAAMKYQSGGYISDAVNGSMCWCPITSLDYADAAYEWNMGQFFSTGTREEGTWTAALSDDLAARYAEYINQLQLRGPNDNVLTLNQSPHGIYTSGSYYNYLMDLIEDSLNHFLKDTTFPYTINNETQASGEFGGGGSDQNSNDAAAEIIKQQQSEKNQTPQTFQTVQEYIASLNADETWVNYDAENNTATITSMEAFVTHCKNASKSVGAFDQLDLSSPENDLFGTDESDALHFDSVIAQLLEERRDEYGVYADWDPTLITAYQSSLGQLDRLGLRVDERMNLYNPMYYLCDYYEGSDTSHVAPNWRIHTGINQTDTALTVEANLSLALEHCASVESVEFETVWEKEHTLAERTGDATSNLIQWIQECMERQAILDH